MKQLITIKLLILAGLILSLSGCGQSTRSNEISLRYSPLHGIALTDQNEQSFKLGDLYGKTVILHFMFNGCSLVQTVALRRAYLDHKLESEDKNIVFVSISIATQTDTPEQLKGFAKRYGIYSKNWRLAVTNQASLDLLLNTLDAGIPPPEGQIGHLNTVFLINEDGEVSKRYKGYPISPGLIFNDLLKSSGEAVK